MQLFELIRKNPSLTFKAMLEPKQIVRFIISLIPFLSFSKKLMWDAMLRPNYGYGLFYAALQAKALDINNISVIEFGVANGKGLVELEKISLKISEELDINIDVYGFDTGEGMPKPLDYRDLPYLWSPGMFKMDYDKLAGKLDNSSLIIGNVQDTIPEFIRNKNISPIGFISFDLDYSSSTMNSFKLFEAKSDLFLPRVFCYFDDVVGDDWELHSEFTGQLLAINNFNIKHQNKKIDIINGLSFKRIISSEWNEKMYIFHDFHHPLYNDKIKRDPRYFDRKW